MLDPRWARIGWLVLGMAACGDADGTSTSTSAGAAGPGSTGPGPLLDEVRLTPLSSVYTEDAVAQMEPPAGDLFILVELQIENGTGQSISLAAPAFAVQTPAGVGLAASPVSEQLDGGCLGTSSLADDGQTTCSLLFEVPAGTITEVITYTGQEGTYEAPLETVCNLCGDRCTHRECCQIPDSGDDRASQCQMMVDCAALLCEGEVLCPEIADDPLILPDCLAACGEDPTYFELYFGEVDPADCATSMQSLVGYCR